MLNRWHPLFLLLGGLLICLPLLLAFLLALLAWFIPFYV